MKYLPSWRFGASCSNPSRDILYLDCDIPFFLFFKSLETLQNNRNRFVHLKQPNLGFGEDIPFLCSDDFPVDQGVCGIWIVFPDINCNPGCPCGRPDCSKINHILLCQYPYTFCPCMNNRVIHHCTNEEIGLFLYISHYFLYDGNFIVFDIPPDSANLKHCIAISVTGDHLEQVKDRFTVFPGPHENSIITEKMPSKAHPEKVAMYAFQFPDDGSNIFSPVSDLNPCNFFHSIGKCKGVRCGTYPAYPFNQEKYFIICF